LFQCGLKVPPPSIGFQVHDGARGEIHEQQAVGAAAAAGIARKDDFRGGKFQFVRQALGRGRGKQGVRQMQRGPGRPTDQSFVGDDAAAGDVENGLEQRVQSSFGDQACDRREVNFALGVRHGEANRCSG